MVFDLAEQYQKPVFAAVSNMSIAMERRNYLSRVACLVCNQQEAELLFSCSVENLDTEQLKHVLYEKAMHAKIRRMVVTLGEGGCIYIDKEACGFYPSYNVDVIDTTGAGDAFFAGVTIGLTYGKTLQESAVIGTACVIRDCDKGKHLPCIHAGGVRHQAAGMKRTAGHTPRLPVIGELRDTERLDTRSYDMRAEGIRLANQRISDPADLQCEECEFDHITFEGSGRGSRFTDVIFRNCDFSATVFDESGFCRCLFENCRLSGTSLVRASFRDVTIRESVMDYANISASSLNSVTR